MAARKRYTPEQIISKLREAEVLLSKGQSTGVACRKIGVTEQTYYRWRKEYWRIPCPRRTRGGVMAGRIAGH